MLSCCLLFFKRTNEHFDKHLRNQTAGEFNLTRFNPQLSAKCSVHNSGINGSSISQLAAAAGSLAAFYILHCVPPVGKI